ncbi:MAG: mxaA protein [Gammaproteobacteria bacterium]|jgi:mxaA protein|nr:mxaA protein [Gammaproteobacteria bacterium]
MRLGRGANGQPRAASIAAGFNSVRLVSTQAAARAAMAITCLLACTQTPVLAAAAPAGTASTTAVVQQPRPFGYVLGDTLTQRILLGPAGSEFQPESLPPAERAGLWFARRSSKIEKAEDDRRWLVIDYQLVNAPQTLITVNLPAAALKSKAGTELVVPQWPISVAPLTPRSAFATGGLQELRPDHPAPMLPTTMLRRQLEIWVIAFAVTVVIWFGWWVVRALRAAANQPFASALRVIRRTGDDDAAAWLALHRAFDRTAGRALQTTTLPVLFKRAPHFETQRAAVEQFYAQSNLRFFDVPPTGGEMVNGSGTTVSLRTLATTLRRIEKQHER